MDRVNKVWRTGLWTFIKQWPLVFKSMARIESGEGVFPNLISGVSLGMGGRGQRW
jgi:hypothetical protein